jgi:hypothetical protein
MLTESESYPDAALAWIVSDVYHPMRLILLASSEVSSVTDAH